MGDADILKLARLNRHLIVQVGGSWGRKLLIKSFLTSFLCKTTIMSFSYYGGNVESFPTYCEMGTSFRLRHESCYSQRFGFGKSLLERLELI